MSKRFKYQVKEVKQTPVSVRHPRGINLGLLAPLKKNLCRGKGAFDIELFRAQRHAKTLRD